MVNGRKLEDISGRGYCDDDGEKTDRRSGSLRNAIMKWKAASRRGGPGSGCLENVHCLRFIRRWPLAYLFATLLFFTLLLPVWYKVTLQKERMMEAKTLFGDNLFPTPWHRHMNTLGPEYRNWDRSLAIFKCSRPRWFHPSRQKTPIETEIRECPAYFQWIKKDLAPWKHTGITPLNMDKAKEHAAFKVVIKKGRLYVDHYYSCVGTRAVFTVWGLLMLLQKYEGNIPDVELMFDCMDRPHITKTGEEPSEFWSPAPLFRYCSNSRHYDIPWPDWSFWGWAETNLDPWDEERNQIIEGSDQKPWRLKHSKAYWRGNPDVGSPLRMQLMQCNSATRLPQAEIHNQNWTTELAIGKRNSRLEDQCQHRYKIYAEGYAWSVSFKYIMACGSPTFVLSPKYYDFFMRSLQPEVHYIPVRPTEICASELCGAIDNTVRRGEKDIYRAIRIGEAGRDFMNNELSMRNVYDYMFHVLKEYAALQRFKPSIPSSATEVTDDFILCLAEPHQRLFLYKAKESIPWTAAPCHMPEIPEDGVQDFAWEAPEHANEGWADNKCSSRKRKTKGRDKGEGKEDPNKSAQPITMYKNGTDQVAPDVLPQEGQ